MIEGSELENLVKYYHEKKLAHAYLVSTNNTSKCLSVLLTVVKNIFCVNEYQEDCNKCSLCHLINLNNLPSLKIIYPDGEFIKKDQILELKNLFSKESLYTKESIYIIVDAHKLNKEAANTMLKFLEEPEGNVIGFFITNEKDNIMSTIRSRTQIIEVNFPANEFETYDIEEDKYKYLNDILNKYLNAVEIEKKGLTLYNREYLLDLEKNDLKIILKMALNKYKRVLFHKLQGKSLITEDSYLNNLSIDNLKKKILLIIELLNEINYNVIIEMFLDRFVIELEVINNETL